MQFYLISALVFSLLVAVFAVQNTETVVIKFFAWSFSISLVLVVLGAAMAGALVLYFLSLIKQVGSWMKIRQVSNRKKDLENQVKKLEEQLASIKNQAEQKAALPEKEFQPKVNVSETGKDPADTTCD